MSEPDIDFLREEVADEVLPDETPAPESTPETVEKQPEVPAAEVTTPPATKEEERVPLAALMAERDKRRDEARRREDLERRLREMETQAKPSFYEAPEDYIKHVEQRLEATAQARLNQALEEQVREAYPDFDEVFDVFKAHAEENPAIVRDVLSKANPPLAAYKLGKQLREYKAMQDPEAYKAKLKAELMSEIRAEMAAEEERKRKAAEAIPPNLADARATKDSEALPDDSLESILKSKR